MLQQVMTAPGVIQFREVPTPQPQPGEVLVVEDALHAARTAKQAGFLVAGVYDPSAEEDQEALRCLCDWYLPRLDSPDFLAALERG